MTTETLKESKDSKVNLCETCVHQFPECKSTDEDVEYGNDIGNDNICECKIYIDKRTNEGQKYLVELLKENKEKTEALYKERDDLEKRLPEKVIYQNEDGTWTRFTKTDNFKTIEEIGIVWKSTSFGRFSTKIDGSLKNEPK